jgi:hypothetical protein
VIILLSGTVGSILAFLTSRNVASNWFRKILERKPNFGVIAQAVDEEGWRIVALMRLGVPIPGAIQNYLFGLTRIDLSSYSISTFIFHRAASVSVHPFGCDRPSLASRRKSGRITNRDGADHRNCCLDSMAGQRLAVAANSARIKTRISTAHP